MILASGLAFASEATPKVVVQVGSSGDSGTVEISNMLFSAVGGSSGAIMMEWNVAATAAGDAGLWDSHFRLGESFLLFFSTREVTDVSNVQVVAWAPTLRSLSAATPRALRTAAATPLISAFTSPRVPPACSRMWYVVLFSYPALYSLTPVVKSGFGRRITTSTTRLKARSTAFRLVSGLSSLDTSSSLAKLMGGKSGGVLVESTAPTWFIGTASEHHTLYQVRKTSCCRLNSLLICLCSTNSTTSMALRTFSSDLLRPRRLVVFLVRGARLSIPARLLTRAFPKLQPYYQPLPAVPAPFTASLASDPTYPSGLQSAWAFYVQNSKDILVGGAGFVRPLLIN